MRGQFITIEGTEGAGKSTVLQFIKAYLQRAHIPVTLTREPGGTLMAEKIRDLLLNPSSERIPDKAELLLIFAARALHIANCILPSLEAGTWVISDRYVDATYAYQGYGRQLDSSRIALLDEWIVGETQPNFTLLLDVNPALGLERTQQRGSPSDRIEQEKVEFFERVQQGYLHRAKENPERIHIIDANQGQTHVEQQVKACLDKFMADLTS